MKTHVATIGRQGIAVAVYAGGERVELRIKGSRVLGQESKDRRFAFDTSDLPDLIEALGNAERMASRKRTLPLLAVPASSGPVVEIFTDGSCWPNPGGSGGWGVVIYDGPATRELSGGADRTTNNRMELQAAIEALAALPAGSNVCVTSDSKYVVRGASEWMRGWKRKGWKKGSGEWRLNHDLWRRLDEQAARHTVEWRWVRGHSGNPGNDRADELARRGMHEQSELSADLEMMERALSY